MSCAESNQIHAHPADAIDIARALVAREQCRRAIAIVDVPYIQESVVGIAQASQVLRIGAEGDALDAKGVIAKGREGNIRRCLLGSREYKNARFIPSLLITSISLSHVE